MKRFARKEKPLSVPKTHRRAEGELWRGRWVSRPSMTPCVLVGRSNGIDSILVKLTVRTIIILKYRLEFSFFRHF